MPLAGANDLLVDVRAVAVNLVDDTIRLHAAVIEPQVLGWSAQADRLDRHRHRLARPNPRPAAPNLAPTTSSTIPSRCASSARHPLVDIVISLTHTDRHYPAIVEVLAPQGQFALIDDPAQPPRWANISA